MAIILKGESMVYKYFILIASKLEGKYCFIDSFFCKKGRDVMSID